MRDRATEKPDGGDRLLVGEDFDVGQASGVVDRDVDELPAELSATDTGGVGAGGTGMLTRF